MLNYSQITKQLSIRGGCGGGRWRIDPLFLVPSKVNISPQTIGWDVTQKTFPLKYSMDAHRTLR